MASFLHGLTNHRSEWTDGGFLIEVRTAFKEARGWLDFRPGLVRIRRGCGRSDAAVDSVGHHHPRGARGLPAKTSQPPALPSHGGNWSSKRVCRSALDQVEKRERRLIVYDDTEPIPQLRRVLGPEPRGGS
jgi:hypothetical protein